MCCNSWGHKELDMPERLKRTELTEGWSRGLCMVPTG